MGVPGLLRWLRIRYSKEYPRLRLYFSKIYKAIEESRLGMVNEISFT
jgi:hypothetical protein